MKHFKSKRVIVVTNVEKMSRRDCLNGIFRFTRECAPWSLRILQADERMNLRELSGADLANFDGVITSESCADDAMAASRRFNLPVVMVGTRAEAGGRRAPRVASVRIDDAEIGRFGAERLCAYGRFASCAFVWPKQESEWAKLRGASFQHEFRRRCRCSFSGHVGDEQLEEWLVSLPKPAAVMAANDTLAFSVLGAANTAAIPIPQAVAVIGVDNDVFLCDMAKPALSSILPDHEEVGFAAARELHRLMMHDSGAKPRTILCRSHKFVERESSRHIAPAARVIREASAFIAAYARRGIVPLDVARHLGVSRRLLDLRFHEFSGKTVMGTIRDCQLDAVKDMLAKTALPIRQITDSCGFSGEAYPKDLFRRRFGMSMRQWRAAHCAAAEL